jgi:phytoene dehydrogenase-like protein
MYIDGGWQTLVNGLLAAAENGKAKIVKGKKVTRVERTDSSRWLVTLSDKTQVSAKIVVIAAGPKDAYSLFNDNERQDGVKGGKRSETYTHGVFGCRS